ILRLRRKRACHWGRSRRAFAPDCSSCVPDLHNKDGVMKTHEQFADDLALYALGELAGNDRQELGEHLHTCAACRRELQALRGDLGLLGLSSSGPQPPARSKERLMRAIAAEPRR